MCVTHPRQEYLFGICRQVMIEDLVMCPRKEVSVGPRCVWHTYGKKSYSGKDEWKFLK